MVAASDQERPSDRVMPPLASGRHAVLLTVAYDGRPYHGFAAQRGQRTVAGELLEAIRHYDAAVAKLVVASRTDAGVHARVQYTAFDTDHGMPPRAWVLGLQQRLPDSLAVRAACHAPAGYNPRFATAGKRYRYLLLRDRLVDPLWAGRAWRVADLPPDGLSALAAELAGAVGEHDFAAFASARDVRQHTRRTLHRLEVSPHADPRVVAIDIEGDGFLHNMVRILVGTAVDAARGRVDAGAIARALQSGARRDAGITAPPHGLYLEAIDLRAPPTGPTWPEPGGPNQGSGRKVLAFRPKSNI